MLIKTKAIILHTIPFKETSIIAYAYSLENGRISLLMNGIRKQKSKTKLNIFQPLSLVDIVYYINNKSDLYRIKEIKRSEILDEIPFRVDKNSIAVFISEIIYKIVKEEIKNEPLFEFLYYSILYLDKVTKNISTFNLFILVQLTKFVGIKPYYNYSEINLFFDLQSGNFVTFSEKSPNILSKKQSNVLHKLLTCSHKDVELLNVDKNERKELLHKIIQYYQLHLDYKIEVKSLKVLEEVFNT